MTVNNKILIKCIECNHEFSILGNDFDFELSSSEERNMGTEAQYCAEIEYECSECGNQIDVIAIYWEYPIGAYNNHDETIHGGELIGTIFRL